MVQRIRSDLEIIAEGGVYLVGLVQSLGIILI